MSRNIDYVVQFSRNSYLLLSNVPNQYAPYVYKGASIKTDVVPIFVILFVLHYMCFFVSKLTVNDACINYSNTCTK